MRQQLEAKPTSATIPLRAARIYAQSLLAQGGELNEQVAQRLTGQIAVAELSGQDRIDMGEALIDAAPESSEVTHSIDDLVDLIIDLR